MILKFQSKNLSCFQIAKSSKMFKKSWSEYTPSYLNAAITNIQLFTTREFSALRSGP